MSVKIFLDERERVNDRLKAIVATELQILE
jgi:hypothetical protein